MLVVVVGVYLEAAVVSRSSASQDKDSLSVDPAAADGHVERCQTVVGPPVDVSRPGAADDGVDDVQVSTIDRFVQDRLTPLQLLYRSQPARCQSFTTWRLLKRNILEVNYNRTNLLSTRL